MVLLILLSLCLSLSLGFYDFSFGEKIDNIPHFEQDGRGFIEGLKNLENIMVWDPISTKEKPWVSSEVVREHYIGTNGDNTGSCVVM